MRKVACILILLYIWLGKWVWIILFMFYKCNVFKIQIYVFDNLICRHFR